jgi:hypothetical protein
MVLPGNIAGAVQVGVNLISARLAPKDGLRRPVPPMHMSTRVATLAGLPGIDSRHNGAYRLSRVGDLQAGHSSIRDADDAGVAPRCLVRVRISVKFSTTITLPGPALATICLASRWSQSLRNRRRRLRIFLRCRLADFVPLDWSLRLGRKYRDSISFHVLCPRTPKPWPATAEGGTGGQERALWLQHCDPIRPLPWRISIVRNATSRSSPACPDDPDR